MVRGFLQTTPQVWRRNIWRYTLNVLAASFPSPTRQITPEVEVLASHTLGLIDNPVDDTPEPVRQRRRYTVEIAQDCRMAIPGVGEESKANRLVARHWLYQKMVEHGVRPSHIRVILPLALELVFVPSQYEVTAMEMRNSSAFTTRNQAYEQQVFNRAHPSIWNWFGSKRYRPLPGGA